MGFGLDSVESARQELALRIIAALTYEITLDRMIGVGDWARRALDALDGAPPHLRSAVRAAAAFRAYEQADGEAAMRFGRAALEDDPAITDPAFVMAYTALGSQAATGGDLDQALAILRDALARIGPAENAPYTAASFHTITAVWLGLFGGDADVARTEAERALAIAQDLRSPIAQALALYGLSCALHQRDPAAALSAAEECMALADRRALIYSVALHDAALLRVQLGDVRGAVAPLRECVVNLDAQGDLPTFGGTVPVVALVSVASGHDEAAVVGAAILADGPFSGYWVLIHESIAADYDTALAQARQRLGPEVAAAAAARGAAMDYHEAVAFLLAELDAATVL